MKDNSLVSLSISLGVLITVLIGGLIFLVYPKLTASDWNQENNCDNNSTNLEQKVNCLVNEQGTWWKYNISNLKLYSLNQNIDWEVIKEQGGVCRHSVVWYIGQAREMGLLAREVVFYPDDGIGHVVALIYDENMTGYCILDQQVTPKCSMLDTTGDEE